MLLDDLKADISRNAEAAGQLPATAMRDHLRDAIWPFFEALVDKLDETLDSQAEAINSLIEGTEEVLHTETAALISTFIVGAAEVSRELQRRLQADPAAAAQWYPKLAALQAQAKGILEIVEEITIPATIGRNASPEVTGDMPRFCCRK